MGYVKTDLYGLHAYWPRDRALMAACADVARSPAVAEKTRWT